MKYVLSRINNLSLYVTLVVNLFFRVKKFASTSSYSLLKKKSAKGSLVVLWNDMTLIAYNYSQMNTNNLQ